MRLVLTSATPGFKIAYLFLFLIIGVFIAEIFARLILLIPGLNDGSEIVSIYVNSITQSVFSIALPAYLMVAWTNSEPMHYLKIEKSREMGQKVMFAILAFLFSYPFSSLLAQWNKGMNLPEWMSGIEKMMRSMEDAAQETTNLLLSGNTIGSLILNLIVVAGLAAVSEEMFFRGALQQFIQEKFKNGHAAVWLTALIFSLVHFQFYGFLPRLFLGALLGYLFLYTRNLWVPVIFHFLNNATVIVLNFFWGDTGWFKSMENATITLPYGIVALVSLLLTILLFWMYRNKTLDKKNYHDTDSTDFII